MLFAEVKKVSGILMVIVTIVVNVTEKYCVYRVRLLKYISWQFV